MQSNEDGAVPKGSVPRVAAARNPVNPPASAELWISGSEQLSPLKKARMPKNDPDHTAVCTPTDRPVVTMGRPRRVAQEEPVSAPSAEAPPICNAVQLTSDCGGVLISGCAFVIARCKLISGKRLQFAEKKSITGREP